MASSMNLRNDLRIVPLALLQNYVYLARNHRMYRNRLILRSYVSHMRHLYFVLVCLNELYSTLVQHFTGIILHVVIMETF
jgi:hypothetical protein